MLGPVVVGLSLLASRWQDGSGKKATNRRFNLFKFVPWFILGFLALCLRSFDLVPSDLASPMRKITVFLTVVSMAALGLGVDVRVLAKVGGRATAAVTLSLALLLGLSIGLIHLFG
jgi:uncharacterized membrane protein YadS